MRTLIALQISVFLSLIAATEFSGPAIVLKYASSAVEFDGFSLLPETSIFFEFYGHSLQGRLLYAENASMGTYISLKLNRPGTLRFEMKLRATNRSHQFIILSAQLDRSTMKWHSANLRIYLLKKLAVLYVDGRDAYPAYLDDAVPSATQVSFGDYLYVGRLPPSLRSDASKVVHFTAAIESSFVGNIRSLFANGRGLEPLRVFNGAEIATGLSFCHVLSREALRSAHSYSPCPYTSDCFDGVDGPTCGCTKQSQNLGICQQSKRF
ncbi:hypothetical protein Aperf_G00000097724 [Anoplocephala perfoliata]